jgi:hypothetical protein
MRGSLGSIESIMEMDTTLHEIARRLRELAAVSPASAADLPAWYTAAKKFESWLSARPAQLLDQVPHFVWHYLADADIRSKDEAYRRHQERELAGVVAELEAGDPA